MRTVCLSVLLFFSVITFYSCANGDLSGKTRIIRDSLATIFPTWQAAQVTLGDNFSSAQVVIGDATFYKASDEAKKTKADELGKMILRVCGKENYLEKGNLIVTADINNTSDAPADGIKIPIDFTALKKANP